MFLKSEFFSNKPQRSEIMLVNHVLFPDNDKSNHIFPLIHGSVLKKQHADNSNDE